MIDVKLACFELQRLHKEHQQTQQKWTITINISIGLE